MLLKVGEAAEFLGVAKSTLRRWETEGKLIPIRTAGNQRRYEKESLIKFRSANKPSKKYTIAYARVSTSDQKEDLARQVDNISNYCIAKGYQFEVIQDLGSGLNYKKKGLTSLIEKVCSGEVERVVINYKDRLVRFGFEMLEQICSIHGVEIEIINLTQDKTYEEELVEDVLSVITVFSSRLYGSRSHKANKIQKETKHLFNINDIK